MANNISDKINKGIARGINLAGQARAIASILGIADSPRGTSISHAVVSELRKNGIARPTYAFSQISLPGALQNRNPELFTHNSLHQAAILTYRNDGFSIPGLSIATSDIRQYGYGPTIKRPYGINYQDVTFNYILDASSNQHLLFYEWMNSIVNHGASIHDGKNAFDLLPYEVGFHNEYVGDISIYFFDETFDNAKNEYDGASKAKIIDAYPTFVGDIQYNWAGVDQLIRIPVTFTYRRWKLERAEYTLDRTTQTSRPTSLFGALLKVGSALQALSTIRSPKNIADVVNVINVGRTIS